MDVLSALNGSLLTPTSTTTTNVVPGAPTVNPANLAVPPGVETAARGFEKMFLSILLKEMRQTLEPETLFPGDKGDVLGGLFDHFLSEHMSQAGSLGIAAMVRKQLTSFHTPHEQRQLPASVYAAAKQQVDSAVSGSDES